MRPDAAHGSKRAQNLRLAEKLGAETHTLIGRSVADTLLDFARERNVIEDRRRQDGPAWWKRTLFGTIVDQLLKQSRRHRRVRGLRRGDEAAAPFATSWSRRLRVRWQRLLRSPARSSRLCRLLGLAPTLLGLAEANIVMIFLAGVALVATRLGRGPAIALRSPACWCSTSASCRRSSRLRSATPST